MGVLGCEETPGGAPPSRRREAGSGRLRPSRPARGGGKRRRPAEGTPAPRANERWDPFPTGSLSAGPWMRTPTPSCWLTSGCSLPRCLQTEGHLRAALSFPPVTRTPSFLPFSMVAQSSPASPASLQAAQTRGGARLPRGRALAGKSKYRERRTSSLDMAGRKGRLHGLPGERGGSHARELF